ncbi:MAG: hypothetical protein ACI8RD_014529 [Bacillariaceae sp.]|jgi:hypothetical protein
MIFKFYQTKTKRLFLPRRSSLFIKIDYVIQKLNNMQKLTSMNTLELILTAYATHACITPVITIQK